jgi:predicted negative regulator of RcsB-dependent stress response
MIKYGAIAFAVFACLASTPAALPQDNAAQAPPPAAAASPSPAEQNLNTYIDLIRKDVRSQKSAIMDAVMQLDPDQAAKFWPIYRDYDADLKKLNDLRLANIKDYAQSYNNLNDAKADQLIQNAISYQKQRMDLLAKYYERVKESLGAVTAARFAQVEQQLLLLIDLQIDSSLPVVGS